ncbi:MAG: phosphomannose isomerase type II C-terminal cupin domain [Tsuneonella suprasediminis]
MTIINARTQEQRPWGTFEVIAIDTRYKIKQITVRPGASLSLQRHSLRHEHWVVIDGTGRVRVGDEERFVQPEAAVYIPAGTIHRLINDGNDDLTLIEIQTGQAFLEDDIERLDDRYGRV